MSVNLQEESFPSTLGIDYIFKRPVQTIQSISSNGQHLPIYFDGKMTLYDKHYKFLKKKPLGLKTGSFGTGPYSLENYPKNFDYPEFPDLPFPTPSTFSKKDEYLEQCRKWKKDMISFTSTVFLPYPIVSHYYIPQKPPEILIGSQQYRRFNPTKASLLPKNYLILEKVVLTKSPADPEKPFPQQIPNRDEVKMKHQISFDSQWQSQLIPKEPLFLLYDNFEEYEKAFQRWYFLSQSLIEKPPIPPSEFGRLAHMDLVPQFTLEPIQNENFDEIIETETENIHWSTNLKASAKLSSIINELRLHYHPFSNKSHKRIEPEQYFVGNFNQDEFKKDLIEYGNHLITITSTSPIHTYFSIPINNFSNDFNLLIDFFQSFSNFNNLKILNFLNINFSEESFLKSLSTSIGNELIQDLLFKSLNISFIPILYSISQYSIQHQLRCAIFLNHFCKSNYSTQLFEKIFKEKNLIILYQFINICIILSYQPIELIKPILDEDILYYNSSFLHLLTIFLTLPVIQPFHPLHQLVLDSLKLNILLLQEHLNLSSSIKSKLWESLSSTSSRDYQIMIMLSSIPSPSFHRILLPTDFLDLTSFTNSSPIFNYFIQRLIYQGCYGSISHFFSFDKLINFENIKLITFKESITISLCINSYSIYLENTHCFINPDIFFDFYNEILNFYNPIFNSLLFELSNLLSNQIILPITSASSYNNRALKASSLVTNICNATIDSRNMDFTFSIQLILPLIIYEKPLKEVLKEEKYCTKLLKSMGGQDSKTLYLSWRLFHRFTKDPSAAETLLVLPYITIELQSMARNENPIIFRKYCNFCFKSLQSKNPIIIKAISEILKKAVGTITCTHKNSSKIYQNYPKTLFAVTQLIKTVETINPDIPNELTAIYLRHSGSVSNDSKGNVKK